MSMPCTSDFDNHYVNHIILLKLKGVWISKKNIIYGPKTFGEGIVALVKGICLAQEQRLANKGRRMVCGEG